MLAKIVRIIGVLAIVIGVVGAIYFSKTVSENSEYLGYSILVANDDIPQGTFIKDVEQAKKYFIAKKIRKVDLVNTALRVDTVESADENLLSSLKAKLFPSTYGTITPELLNKLVNRTVLVKVMRNQQILDSYMEKGVAVDITKDEKEFAIPIDYLESVGGEIQKGDMVDLWIQYSDKANGGSAEKIIGPIKVNKIKDGNNEEIQIGDKRIPKIAIFWLKDDNIKLLRDKQQLGVFFLTKLKQ